MRIAVRPDGILSSQLGGHHAYDLGHRLRDGETVRLVVDGIVGSWTRTNDTCCAEFELRPVGAMASVWLRLQCAEAEVEVDLPDHEVDPRVRAFNRMFEEWRSAEDDEAFADL